MSDVAIRVETLGKQYSIGKRERYQTLRDTLTDVVTAPVRWLRRGRSANGTQEHIWALKDVSFEIPRGEVVGIIGRNGAGKSTLLKVLSRITEPTEGEVRIHGRVGSLLEVGTGFHPELTGRENIYLNGAILGMRKAEIARKFDEIVAFAEIDKFLDTPVKHYSSGMYVRLAFGVAAHLEPEILVVDEVLAVGDAAFQKKCLRRMAEVGKEGRTVLFVSHNLATIGSLCRRSILLQGGQLASDGPTEQVLERYLKTDQSNGPHFSLQHHPNRINDSKPVMVKLVLFRGSTPSGQFSMGDPLTIKVDFESSDVIKPVLGVVIKTAMGAAVFSVNNRIAPAAQPAVSLRKGSITCHFERTHLMPGSYIVDLYLGDGYRDFDVIPEAGSFEVNPADVFGSGRLPASFAGVVYCPAVYTIAENGSAARVCDTMPGKLVDNEARAQYAAGNKSNAPVH